MKFIQNSPFWMLIIIDLIISILIALNVYILLNDNNAFKNNFNALTDNKTEKIDNSNNKKKFGDNNTLVCSKTENNEDGYTVNDTMIITYKDSKVTKVEETNIEEMESDMVEFTVSLGTAFANNLNVVEGFNIEYSKASESSVKFVATVDFIKLDLNSIKELFGEDFDENSFYAKKDITLDDFIADNLMNYTCK